MDDQTFDALTRILSRRRSVLALLSAVGLGGILADGIDARKRKKKKCKKKKCGACRKCKKGKCKPKPDGTDCGTCSTCQAGECVVSCPDDQVCDGDECVDNDCPPGEKPCQGECIPETECCGECPTGEVCCENVGLCKDILNDPDFCGSCTNGQCQGSDFCANGACCLPCSQTGQLCFAPSCFCANRADPAHSEQACVQISPFTCDTVDTCDSDADCGFQSVCVSDFCAGKIVCADPCT